MCRLEISYTNIIHKEGKMKYLYIIQQAMVWILTIYWLYQLIVSLCSLVKLKDKPLVINKNHKFMAILPAHNEEML